MIFSRHIVALCLGLRFLPQPCPCQKQPSTNTASFDFGNAKSGLPNNGNSRRHPLTRAERRSESNFSSVVAFRLLRTRDIKAERDSPPNVVFACLLRPGQRLMALLQLFVDPLACHESKTRRNSVTNHIAYGIHLVGYKFVAPRERLDQRCLTN